MNTIKKNDYPASQFPTSSGKKKKKKKGKKKLRVEKVMEQEEEKDDQYLTTSELETHKQSNSNFQYDLVSLASAAAEEGLKV